MNIKTLTAIVSTLSLGSLATGCVTSSGSTVPSTEKGARGACRATAGEASCSGNATQKGGEASCGEGSCSTKATQKGGEASCGEGSCGGAKKAATPEKGSQGGCGENSCAGGR